MRRPRYSVHAGWVRSATDGDNHWISAHALARLYKLAPGDWIRFDEQTDRPGDGYIHLYPRSDGNYSLKAKPEAP